jgi:hypothetical protein
VYEFAGDLVRAKACYVDLEKLYPNTEAAEQAKQRIENLTKPQKTSSQETESL